MTRTYVSCCVVGSNDCHAPANLDGPALHPLATCYGCGERVCRDPACSMLHLTRAAVGTGKVRTRRRVRLCWTCLVDRVGEGEALRMLQTAYDEQSKGRRAWMPDPDPPVRAGELAAELAALDPATVVLLDVGNGVHRRPAGLVHLDRSTLSHPVVALTANPDAVTGRPR